MMRLLLLAACLASPLLAQAPDPAAVPGQAPQASTQPAGLTPPWEATRIVEDLREPAGKLNAALGRLTVRLWEGPAAPNYVGIVESARRQISAIGAALELLAKQPDRLTSVVRLFVALQQIEPSLDNAARGAEQFQSLEAAQDIRQATNAFMNRRQRLVEYMLELASFMEKNTGLQQQELDACRRELFLRQQAPPRRR